MEPRRGAIAVCGIGTLGLITSDEIQKVEYPDGNKGEAWTGIHLTNKVCTQFSPWSSRHPIVLGYLQIDFLENYIETIDKLAKFTKNFHGK